MKNLNQKLVDLFQVSDGLLLPGGSTQDEISRIQKEIESFGEELVLQGFMVMKDFLQELAGQNGAGLVNIMDGLYWTSDESPPSNRPKSYSNTPSLWELTRHLSNWMEVFVRPIRTLDIHGDIELIKCLESTVPHISILAAIMLGHEEFNYLGSIEKFTEILNTKQHTSLRLETCRLIYSHFHDPYALRKEVVPKIISNDSEYDAVFENGSQRKKFLSYIRELVIWDIASNGNGPQTKWSEWWI